MSIVLKRFQKPIVNGWASGSPNLGLVAHGRTPELADENLKRTARLYLGPSERDGTLREKVAALGLVLTGEGDELQIEVVD